MNAYAVFYDSANNTYVKADGKTPFAQADTLKYMLMDASHKFDQVTVVLEDSTGAHVERTFISGWHNGSQPQSSTAVDILSAFFNTFCNFIDSPRNLGQVFSALTVPIDFKATLKFQGIAGQLDLSIDLSNRLLSGKSTIRASLETGVTFAQNLTNGIISSPYATAAAVTAGILLAPLEIPAVTAIGMVVAGGLTATLLSAGLGYAENGLVQQATGYDDLGAYAVDSGYQALREAAQAVSSTLKIGNKNALEIYSWKDPATGNAKIKGDDFVAEIDPKTGTLTFHTGIEVTRQAFKEAPALEGLTNLVKQKLGDPYGLWTKVDLLNTADPTKKTTYTRIPKELETRTQLKTGTAVNLNTLTPVKQTDSAKYYTPTQIAPLKLKTNEYNQAKKDQVQAGISAAKANGTLTNLNKQQGIEDQARKLIKASSIAA